MDFDSREALWTSFIRKSIDQSIQETSFCKTCAALEILKLSVCAGDCSECEINLLDHILPEVPKDALQTHLDTLHSNTHIFEKLMELEKKIPLYNENYTAQIDQLESKVNDLMEKLDQLLSENKNLKSKLLLAQAYSLEYKDTYTKCLNELEGLRKAQEGIEICMEKINQDITGNKELMVQVRSSLELEKKIDKLDDSVMDEYGKIDELWGEVQEMSTNQKKIENNHLEVKKYIIHCQNLDKATETVLEYHYDIMSFMKNIDSKVQEMLKVIKSENSIEVTSDEYRNKVMELRKKTNECLLNSN